MYQKRNHTFNLIFTAEGPGMLAAIDVVPNRQEVGIPPCIPHRAQREKLQLTFEGLGFWDNSQVTMNWTLKLFNIELVDAVTQTRRVSPHIDEGKL